MKRTYLFLAFFGVYIISASAQSKPSKQDIKAVLACFDDYKAAIAEKNGKKALACIDHNTISYYNTMLRHALKSDSATINHLNFTDKMLVLSMRHRIDFNDLVEMDAPKVFTYAVENDWIGNDMSKNSAGEILVDGTEAKLQLVKNGKATPFYVQMHKSKHWQMDITSLLPIAEKALYRSFKNVDISENDFIFLSLKQVTGKAVNQRLIWQPLKKF